MTRQIKPWVRALVLVLAVAHAWGQTMPFSPVADPKAVVEEGNARFTVLTDHIIRMEWSASGFMDNATWAFVNRRLPVPSFSQSRSGNWLTIKTSALALRYFTPATTTFNASTLSVTYLVNGEQAQWAPQPTWNRTVGGNLLGTIRTLDDTSGPVNLDCYTQSRDENLHCTLGVISRDGYVVIDDTNRPKFTNMSDFDGLPWLVNNTAAPPPADMCLAAPEERRDCGYDDITSEMCMQRGCCVDSSASNGVPSCFYPAQARQDLYFFGHGLNYKLALKEFTTIAAPIPLPPRFAFGIFYSRYWAFDDHGDKKIVNNYADHTVPLDVVVNDMDWHLTFYKQAAAGVKDQAGQPIGWTGFTWNPALFPDPAGYLAWCKEHNLHNTINIHPASGVQPWEAKYPAMARASGINPATKDYVPFQPSKDKFVNDWLSIVIQPLADDGIDFFWLDWQQGESWIDIPGVNPTFWLNYMFFNNPWMWRNDTAPVAAPGATMSSPPSADGVAGAAVSVEREGQAFNKRPMILHRFGGLGNHRMQVGFSGDVEPTWDALNFQPYFTITAANVGFSYWSHDIGGHLKPTPAEMYVRWVQWGSLSPVFRTHCTKNADNFRRIWLYPDYYYEMMRDAMRLRWQLVPFSYTQGRLAHDTGVGALHGLYYDWPTLDDAYRFPNQFVLGEAADLVVLPVTVPVDGATAMTQMTMWVPPGDWVEWYSGAILSGPKNWTRSYKLEERPILVKQGSVIPMRTADTRILGSAQEIPESLLLTVFPGAASQGTGRMYDDAGDSTGYLFGEYAWTTFTFNASADRSAMTVSVGALEAGSLPVPGLPTERSYDFRVVGVVPATVTVRDGSGVSAATRVDYEDFVAATTDPAARSACTRDIYSYDGQTAAVVASVCARPLGPSAAPVSATITSLSGASLTAAVPAAYAGRLSRAIGAKVMLDNQWGIDTVYQSEYQSLVWAAEAGQRLTYHPETASTEFGQFDANMTMALTEVGKLSMNTTTRGTVTAQLQPGM